MRPIGKDETNPGVFGERIYREWGNGLRAKRSDISAEDIEKFGQAMWSEDFVIAVPRSFLFTVQTPLLVLPGNDPAHPIGVGREVARLLPNAEIFDRAWKDADVVPETVERMWTFRARTRRHWRPQTMQAETKPEVINPAAEPDPPRQRPRRPSPSCTICGLRACWAR